MSIIRIDRCTKILVLLLGVAFAGACTQPGANHPPGEAFDPYEANNRQVHAFNKRLDRALVRPASRGYSGSMPNGIETMVGRFAGNLSLPRSIVNNILQGNGSGASEDFLRLVVNTTVGVGGLFDPATAIGLPDATDADFGQTMHAWGIPQGAYVELPVLGPSTERAAVGRVVDIFTNPLSYWLDSPEAYYGTAASAVSGLSNRGRYSDSVDSILYESADSYAQSRSLYLQNRRFKLGNGDDEAYLDPYDSPDMDPYEDPYDQ